MKNRLGNKPGDVLTTINKTAVSRFVVTYIGYEEIVPGEPGEVYKIELADNITFNVMISNKDYDRGNLTMGLEGLDFTRNNPEAISLFLSWFQSKKLIK